MRAGFMPLAFLVLLFRFSAHSRPIDERPWPEARLDTASHGTYWIVLSPDHLLFSDFRSTVRLRSDGGAWGPEIRLPLGDILAIEADREGFLVSGVLPRPVDSSVIILFDTTGRELRRWYPPKLIFDLSVTQKGRWASTWDSLLLPLREDGSIGPPEKFPPSLSIGRISGTRLIEEGRSRVLCRGRDITKANSASAQCESLGPPFWSFAVAHAEIAAPLICGPWIVFRTGPILENLVVYSLRSGALMGSRDLKGIRGTRSPVACADSQTLALGGRSLEFAQLPGFATVWKKPLRRGRIADLAVLRDEILFRLYDSPEIFSLAR